VWLYSFCAFCLFACVSALYPSVSRDAGACRPSHAVYLTHTHTHKQVAEALKYLHNIYTSIDRATIDLTERSLDLLVEMADGCFSNQAVMFDNKGKHEAHT
jgi:hypothetical protein